MSEKQIKLEEVLDLFSRTDCIFDFERFWKIKDACMRAEENKDPSQEDINLRAAMFKWYDDKLVDMKRYTRIKDVEILQPSIKKEENVENDLHSENECDTMEVDNYGYDGGVDMAKKVCNHCGSEIEESVLAKKNSLDKCLVCGEYFEDRITCPECKTTIKREVVARQADPNICPVCDTRFDKKTDAMIEDEILASADKNMQVIRVGNESSNCEAMIHIICKKCGDQKIRGRSRFEIVTDRYVKLKPQEELICDKCGYKSTKLISVNIPKPIENAYSNVPHCPHCNAISIEKISTSSKITKAALIGVFAIPAVGKQFKCKVCGYKW